MLTGDHCTYSLTILIHGMHAFAGRYIRRPPVYMYLGHTPHVSEIKGPQACRHESTDRYSGAGAILQEVGYKDVE
jgi:hypothetical protein